MLRRNIVEDEGNAVFAAFVHHAMCFLVIDFVSLANLKLVWATIDHEAHARVGGDRYVNTVPSMK